MNQALYRKHRSKSFEQVVGQDHITKTLKSAIKSGRISHAYLFTGPRGVGKTSVARILAHAVNDFPYESDTSHLDIIEIDAASNRRIDEIRDLREKVQVTPAIGKYKVYIVDEVHMLTREAFNALLKTLEEPPAHIIFILATTEAHKLPETIISRTQRFEFKPIGTAQAAAHLAAIAKKESIKITPEAINLIAEFGNGSFRDSISYLDQMSTKKNITEDDVKDMLGLPADNEINRLIKNMLAGNTKQLLQSLQSIKEQGIDPAAVARALAKRLRSRIIESGGDPIAIALLKQLIDVPAGAKPYDLLELSLLEASAQYSLDSVPASSSKKAAAAIAKPEISGGISPKPAANRQDFKLEDWENIVNSAKDKAASLYTALRLAEPSLAEGALVLRFKFPLHQKKVQQAKNKAIISDLIQDATGSAIEIICEVDKSAFKQGANPKSENDVPLNDSSLHSISNVFGGAEVLD